MSSIEKLYSIFKEQQRISTDSRQIVPGSVFFALKGPSFNGNAFADSAIEKGAALVVIDDLQYKKDERYFLVDDALKTLQELAHFHRRQLKIPFLAITGSNGKTTTKELIHRVLSKKFRTRATLGNLNNHIGVPLTILSITPSDEFAVIEMGANHLHEIGSYCRIAEPDFGLITNVGKAHLEGFGGFDGVKKGKGELYAWIATHHGTVFINEDNELLTEMAREYRLSKLVRYGTKGNADCKAALIRDQTGLHVKWKQGDRTGEFRSSLSGEYNFENLLAAVCVGNYFLVDPPAIDAAVSNYVPDNNRSQVIIRGSNTILMDAYNANPTSMEAALRNFSAQPGDHKIVCLGDMAELGKESAAEHEKIIGWLKAGDFEQIILVGKEFGASSALLNCHHFEDSGKAMEWLKSRSFSGRSFLIKGSRSTRMEKILEAL